VERLVRVSGESGRRRGRGRGEAEEGAEDEDEGKGQSEGLADAHGGASTG